MTDDFRVIPQSNGIDELVRVVNCIHDRIDSVGLSQNGGSTSSPSFSNAFGSTGIVLSEPGASYTLPVASTFVLGAVKIGDGVNIVPDGTISVLHNGLSDLQDASGGVSEQHYHLSSAQAETAHQLNLAGTAVVNGQQLVGHTDGSFHFETTILYSGVTSKPSYTDNGDGSITIGSGVYNLYTNPNGTGVISSFSIPGGTFSLTDNSTNYIFADYNSGSPQITVTTNRSVATANSLTNIAPIFKIYRSGTILDQLDFDEAGNALSEKLLLRMLDTRLYERAYGLVISDAGSQHFDVSAGEVYYAAKPISLGIFNSSSNTTYQYAWNGSSWSYTSVSVYNNSQYQGATGLSALPSGKYAVNWIYRSISNNTKCFILLGLGAYNLNDAIAAQPPGNVPDVISTTAMLVGKIIVAQGATSATAVYSAFDVAYTSAASNGTVTSVGLSLPNIFNVTNSPVTTSGTLTATLASQTANTFFAAPNGSSGTPYFRVIYAADVSDSTTAGRTLVTAADAAAQRTALGVVADSLVVHKAGVETMTALKKISLNSADIAPVDANVLMQLIGADGSGPRVDMVAAAPGSAQPSTIMRTSRGTISAPTATQASDLLGYHAFRGYGVSAWSGRAAYIGATATENFTNSANGASIDFFTTPNGTTAPRHAGSWGQDGVLYANYGINLGGTANLSSYGEGTWTPTATNLGGTGITYSTKWIKTGNGTDCTITISGTGLASTYGSTTLTLPFTPARIAIGNAENGSMSGGVAKAATNGKVYLPTISSTSQINITVKIFHN